MLFGRPEIEAASISRMLFPSGEDRRLVELLLLESKLSWISYKLDALRMLY